MPTMETVAAPAATPATSEAPAPAPVVAPAPAPAPAPRPAPAPFPEKKVSAERDPLVAAAARPPVLSSAVSPSFVADDLFGTPERTPPPSVEPEKPAPPAGPTLFPDDDLTAEPDGPNAFQRFFAACGAALRRFGSALRRFGARIGAAFKARWVRPALLGVAGVVVLAALVGLVAALLPAGGEEDPAETVEPDAPVTEVSPPPPDPEIPEGPVEIVPVLPAPRSFAK